MVLSRLRHPAISRAPSLLRARLFASSVASSSRSHRRICNGQFYLGQNSGTCMRSALVSGVTGIDGSQNLRLRLGPRHLSSAGSVPHTVLRMPALSPTMTQGNITKWRKKEGEKIEAGDVLCEIETDKATLEFESLDEGFLAKILVAEGSKDVPVQVPIAIMVEEEDDIQNVPATLEDGSVGKEETSTRPEIKQEESTEERVSDLPPHIVLAMPALSPTMDQGNIAKWRKKEGDKIEVGDIICEIETDKATLEFESLEEGYLAKILVPEGAKDVAVGKPIALFVEDAENIEAIKSSSTGGSEVETKKQVHQGVVDRTGDGKPSFTKISPAARILISEYGLEASSLKASGPRGTLLKTDVLAAIASGNVSKKTSVPTEKKQPSKETQPKASSISSAEAKSTPTQSVNYEDLPNSQIRKIIARRLLESKQNTPHLYLQSDVVLDPLLVFRKELQEKHDVKVSVNDIVIKAVAVALRNVRQANAFWDAAKGDVVLCNTVDISIAVATEKGLMTPIIRNADQKSISAISKEVKELAQKARAGKLAPHEFQGGTFSISNLGMYPVDHFCAIINPPQAGILAVGRGNKVVEPMITSDGIEKPVVVMKMNVTLSADHRVFDGQVGAAFFSELRSNFTDVRRLLL